MSWFIAKIAKNLLRTDLRFNNSYYRRMRRMWLEKATLLRKPTLIARYTGMFSTMIAFTFYFPFSQTSIKALQLGSDKPKKTLKESAAGSLRLINVTPEIVADIETADHLYNQGYESNHQDILQVLLKHENSGESEILWRIARLLYEAAKGIKGSERKEVLLKAFEYAQNSLALDDEISAVHKWMAILLNEVSKMNGIKEQIGQSLNVKRHMQLAHELDPSDPTCMYLLGQWCYSVADVSWLERKLATALFGTPPTSTFEEALHHFLLAESTRPFFYSMNLLMLAKTYIKLDQPNKAGRCLHLLSKVTIKTEDDLRAREEAKRLRKILNLKENFEHGNEVPPSQEART